MGTLLTEGVAYYLIRLVMFVAVAAVGIAAGIKVRKHKNEKGQASEPGSSVK